MIRLVLVLAFCLMTLPASADDSAEANKLMVEAIGHVDAVATEPSAKAKIDLLRKAHDNLTAIIERYPSTELAVKLASGQRIGRISLAGVRRALDQALLARPRKPGAPVRVWQHRGGIALAAFFRRGRRVLTVGAKGIAAVRDIGTGKVLHTWQHEGVIAAAALSHDLRRIMTAGADRRTALRSARTGRLLANWRNRGAASAVALSPDGRRALVGLWSAAYLVEIRERKVLRTWKHRAPVTTVAYAPDGRRVLMGSADGRATLGDPHTGAKLHRWKHKGSAGGGITTAAFSADGRRVLTGAANGVVALRDVRTGRTLRKWDIGYGVRARSVAFSPNEPWVLIGDDSGKVGLHHAGTGKLLRRWRYGALPSALAFSPDSRRLLMGFGDGFAIVCDLELPRRGHRARTVLAPNRGCR